MGCILPESIEGFKGDIGMVVRRRISICLFIVCAVIIQLSGSDAQAAGCRIDIGSKAPQLMGPDLNGQFLSLDDYRGKWVYIDFWASWCSPCMSELPGVIALDQEFQYRDDVEVLSVSLDDTKSLEKLEEIRQKYNIDYPVLFEGNGWESSNRQSWCVDSIPATFLIDPEGNVVYNNINAGQASQFLNRQQEALRDVQLHNNGMTTQATGGGVVSKHGGSSPSSGVYIPHQRIQVRTGEDLRRNSPSTGSNEFRDFEVLVDILENSPNVNRYQLFLSTLVQKDDGSYDNIDLRYDIDVTFNAADLYRPYDVKITDRSAGESMAGEGSSMIPGIQVMVDPYQRKYRFIVPLPARILDIHYVLGLYDANLGEYIRNQPTVVDLASFGIEY
jgi:peroxiredoxin